jgi:tetratricopeptide (TPR) repeat protein
MFAQPEADRLVQAATAALTQGRITEAARLLEAALRSDPRHPMALSRQAELALYRKDHGRALALTSAALAIEPNFAPAWHQRSSACWLAGRPAEAVQAARRAVHIQPPNPEFRLRLAQFAAWSRRSAEAREALTPLLEPPSAETAHRAAATSMLGELAIAEGRFEEANGLLEDALGLHPNLDVTRMLLGMNRLRLGQFRAGWAGYAARERIPGLYPDGQPRVADEVWQGQALGGKTLVVLDDQGHGDAIQFFRYLPLLRDRGAAHVTWRSFPALVRLLAAAAPGATVVDVLPPCARFDFQCNSTSLARWFGTEADSIPAEVPYLWPPCRSNHFAVRQAGPEQRHVGLVWSGDKRHARDHLRSIPARLFLTLADIPDLVFHSLQHEVRAADLPALTARPAIGRQVEQAADLADTAALIGGLDLVITVDTAVAHLAGAMGKPVWIVLHVAPDWRWLTRRADSPWYPSVRLFRVTPDEWLGPQLPEGDILAAIPPARSESPFSEPVRDESGWTPVLRRVAAALAAFAAG